MHRRGFTLVEMLVVLTIGTVVAGVSIGALHLLMRIERTGRDHVPRARTLMRLAEQFRDDAGMALDQTAGEKQWRFALPDDCSVTYRALPGEVRREEHKSGKPVRQESFILPADCEIAIEKQSEGEFNQSILVITEKGKETSADREMRIIAVLGKDHRFTNMSSERP